MHKENKMVMGKWRTSSQSYFYQEVTLTSIHCVQLITSLTLTLA